MENKIECSYCFRMANFQTPTDGIYVCSDPDCHSKYIEDQCEQSDDGFFEE